MLLVGSSGVRNHKQLFDPHSKRPRPASVAFSCPGPELLLAADVTVNSCTVPRLHGKDHTSGNCIKSMNLEPTVCVETKTPFSHSVRVAPQACGMHQWQLQGGRRGHTSRVNKRSQQRNVISTSTTTTKTTKTSKTPENSPCGKTKKPLSCSLCVKSFFPLT